MLKLKSFLRAMWTVATFGLSVVGLSAGISGMIVHYLPEGLLKPDTAFWDPRGGWTLMLSVGAIIGWGKVYGKTLGRKEG